MSTQRGGLAKGVRVWAKDRATVCQLGVRAYAWVERGAESAESALFSPRFPVWNSVTNLTRLLHG